MDCKIKTETMELDGKTFVLSCNFNVLADIQAMYGDLSIVLNLAPMLSARVVLAAMMNDYAESQGWPKQDYTPREAGRMLPTAKEETVEVTDRIIGLLRDAVCAKPVSKLDTKEPTEDKGKN